MSRLSLSIKPPSISHEDNEKKSTSSAAQLNILEHKVADLEEQLCTQMKNYASLASEKLQVEKALQMFTSPTKKRPEDVVPKQSIQTQSEQKAERKYVQRRKDGLIEQRQSRKILDSERVQISRQPTRSQTRSGK